MKGVGSMFSKIIGSDPGEFKGLGYSWEPNKTISTMTLKAVSSNSAPGLYLCFSSQIVSFPNLLFDSPDSGIGVIYQIPQLSNAFKNTVIKTIPEDQREDFEGLTVDALARTQGYLDYANKCLNYIYGTNTGKSLLDDLKGGRNKTMIFPSGMGNQVSGAGNKYARVVNAILFPDTSQAGNTDNQAFLKALKTASSSDQTNSQMTWLATQINQMPLYSLFTQDAAFPNGLLANQGKQITGPELFEWFNKRNASPLYQRLNNDKYEEVDLMAFVVNSAIIALYRFSDPDTGGDSNIDFDIKDYSQNTIGLPKDTNTVNDRPPAIGLAHELVHAYYNNRGLEPGVQAERTSTTLAELICVGLGPWQNAAISENAIRGEWPANNVPADDNLNNRPAPPRVAYDAQPNPGAIRQARSQMGCI